MSSSKGNTSDLVVMKQYISNTFDKKDTDSSNAFDCISHGILLGHWGFNDTLIKMLAS